VRLEIFLAASAGFLVLSWRSLKNPRSHGFYRFFGFEILAALVLRNAPFWFRDPFSLRQLVSWLLGAVSIALAIEGFRLLCLIGKPAAQPVPGPNLDFENTTTLVTIGAYRWIRHPLYASLLALVWCACLKNVSPASLALATAASGFFVVTALVEEAENLERFGAPYAAYSKRTRRFVPFVF
jgi:protein-S-isoprenylcysteine O-methyltransferase Ste14